MTSAAASLSAGRRNLGKRSRVRSVHVFMTQVHGLRKLMAVSVCSPCMHCLFQSTWIWLRVIRLCYMAEVIRLCYMVEGDTPVLHAADSITLSAKGTAAKIVRSPYSICSRHISERGTQLVMCSRKTCRISRMAGPRNTAPRSTCSTN